MGYPKKFKKNVEIFNINNLDEDENDIIFHAGTISKNGKVYSNGGRVLNFVSISEDFIKSRKQTIQKIKKLNWENGFYRSDIGYKIIDK